ncbi:MAG: DUF1566 domain-containing protein [Deltaproteobacteria bacterium]|nr:DUF1566 domain-containing protein [Deltaproteobacteria bacterium]
MEYFLKHVTAPLPFCRDRRRWTVTFKCIIIMAMFSIICISCDAKDDSVDDENTIKADETATPDGGTDGANEDTSRINWNTYEYDGRCETATTPEECEALSAALPLPDEEGSSCWHECHYYADFQSAVMAADGTCTVGETTIGFCGYVQYCEGSRPSAHIQGCADFSNMPLYVENDNGLFFGNYQFSDLQECSFSRVGAQMSASPKECECLCDGGSFHIPEDEALSCDYDTGVCTDAGNNLMWQQKPTSQTSGYATLDQVQAHCASLTTGGYTGWRVPTFDEFRTLVRGCPETAPAGNCALSHECTGVDCSSNCNGCEKFAGGGPDGIYLPFELDWNIIDDVWVDAPAWVEEGAPADCERVWAFAPRTGGFVKRGCTLKDGEDQPIHESPNLNICVRTLN